MEGPDSSYSCWLIHICWKVDSEARMESPIHTEYLMLWGNDDLDLHGAGCQGGDLLRHPVGDAWLHGGAARRYCVLVQVFADVHVTGHDGVEGGVVDATRFHAEGGRLEQCLRTPKPLITDGDDLASRQLIALLQRGGGCGCGHLLLEVQGDVAHDLPLHCGGEAVAVLSEDLHEVVGQVPASQVQTQDSVGKVIALVDGHCVGDPISRVHDNASGAPRGVEGQHSLDSHVRGRGTEGLKHDLSHVLSVGLGVQEGLGQQHGVLLRGHKQLVVEGVVPDFLHVIPVADDAVLDGVLQGQDAALALGLVANIGVLLTHADHHALVLRAPNNGGKHGSGGIIPSKASFARAGTIVDDDQWRSGAAERQKNEVQMGFHHIGHAGLELLTSGKLKPRDGHDLLRFTQCNGADTRHEFDHVIPLPKAFCGFPVPLGGSHLLFQRFGRRRQEIDLRPGVKDQPGQLSKTGSL
ncbi:hypothetical protein AAY473_020487 [Plecturocebus cupreus]